MLRAIVLLSIVVTVAVPARAQETTGSITGTVTSEDGQPLPGVSVTIVDPETGLQRSATAGGRGDYRLTALPPSVYQLTAALDGFQTVRRSARIELGRTLTQDVEMAMGAFSETIEVSGDAPLLDRTSTVSGINVTADELQSRLPIRREATEVAFLAPSTAAGDSAFETGFTPGQRPVSIAGGTVSENAYQVNGLNITNFRKLIGSTMVPYEFLQEVQVKTGGYEAEFGRSTGGVINMITKSGTNSLQGAVSAYWEPDSLQGHEPDTYDDLNSLEEREQTEVNGSLGGPILRDHLFFFGFVRYVDSSSSRYTPGRSEAWSLSQPYWGGKLDWSVTSRHRIEGTYIDDAVSNEKDVHRFDFETGVVGDLVGTGWEDRGGSSWILKYTGLFTDNLLLAAQYGVNDFDRTDRSDGDDCPYVHDRRSGLPVAIGCWVNSMRVTAADERRAYRLDVDWYLGGHALRAGIDSEDNTSDNLYERSGGVRYMYLANPDADGDGEGDLYPEYPIGDIVQVSHREQGGSFPVESQAAYLQDGWAVTPAVTLNIGLRWEAYLNKNGLGQDFIEVDNQWAPRLGVVWNPGAHGRQKLYASVGRYHLPVASNTNVLASGALYVDGALYPFSGEPDPVDGSPPGFTDCGFGATCPDQGSVGELLLYQMLYDGTVPDPKLMIADAFDPISQDEAILGYERLVGDNWSLGARAITRRFNEVIEDFSLDQVLWESYGTPCLDPDLLGTPFFCSEFRVGNPGRDFSGWYDVDGDGTADRIAYTAAELGYPEPVRDYFALELTFRRRFADRWMLQGAYTWSHLYGNFEGYVNSDVGQSDAGLNQTYDYPGLVDNAWGDMPQDRRHNLKLFGSYSFDNGVQLGGNFWLHTGRPVNAISVHPTDPYAANYGTASFFLADGTPAPRGSRGRTDTLWSLDLMAGYTFRVGGFDLFVRVDAFNLLDNEGVAEVDEMAEDSYGAVNPYWLEPTTYQPPRAVRLGIGASF
jgi:hypothetical protein